MGTGVGTCIRSSDLRKSALATAAAVGTSRWCAVLAAKMGCDTADAATVRGSVGAGSDAVGLRQHARGCHPARAVGGGTFYSAVAVGDSWS